MISEERVKRQKELVQSMGRFYEKGGFPPVAARIFSLLIIMDKEQYTFEGIVEELQISKGAVSNALQILEIQNLIEYTTITGDRKRYFHLKKLDTFNIIDEHLSRLKSISVFLTEILELKAVKDSDNSLYIKELIEMLDFFLLRFEDLKKEYLNVKKQ